MLNLQGAIGPCSSVRVCCNQGFSSRTRKLLRTLDRSCCFTALLSATNRGAARAASTFLNFHSCFDVAECINQRSKDRWRTAPLTGGRWVCKWWSSTNPTVVRPQLVSKIQLNLTTAVPTALLPLSCYRCEL